MTRMRTINEASQHLKESDPGSRVTAWTIRTLVKTGRLSHVRVGSRILINLDTLENYLSEPHQSEENNSFHTKCEEVRNERGKVK